MKRKSRKNLTLIRGSQEPRSGESATPTPSRSNGLQQWALTGVLLATAVVGTSPTPLAAQAPTQQSGQSNNAPKQFEIAEGPLSDALAAFTRATGIVVLDQGALVGDQTTAGVRGMMTTTDALRRLLSGTGITYRVANARQIRLTKGDVADATQLSNVTVVGARSQISAASPKYTEPVRDIPQSITVVPQSVLESQGVTSLRDAVRNISGLTVNAGEGGATPGDNFNIRGFSARSDIFVNGVRDVGGYSRETFNIEQVEVTKGPSSVYAGRGSTGGSINLVTKTPHAGSAYNGGIGVGSADYKRMTADINQPLDDMGLKGSGVRLNAQYQYSGTPGVAVINNKSWGVAPSVAFGLTGKTQFTADFLHAAQDNLPTYGVNSTSGGPPEGVDTHQYFGVRNLDFERVRADQGTARLTHAFNDAVTLRNLTSWGQTDVHRIVTSANPDGTRRSPSHITYDRNLTNQTVLNAGFKTANIEHAVVTGAEVTHEGSRFASYVFTGALPKITDLKNPSEEDQFTGTYKEGKPRRSATANSVGFYSFDTMKFGSHWEVSGGLRYDTFSPQYKDSLERELPRTDSRALTWRAGTVFKPTEEASFYAAYGTSFNPTGELLSLDNRGTTGLEPEKNRSVEVGTKWDTFRRRLLLTAAVFRTEKTNARITDPLDPSGASLVLAGKQRVDGFEVGASGRLAENWNLFGGWTWLDGKIIHGNAGQDGTVIPNTPKHTLNVWTSGRVLGRLELGGGVRHVGERLRTATQSVPAYTAWDADAALPVTRSLLFRLNLVNLTDATYYDSGRYWVPASGRAVRLSTNLTF